jgi:predicted Fe-S protein YdhL (DUF1289 family)
MQTQIAELLASFEELKESWTGSGGSGDQPNPSQETNCPIDFTKLPSGCYRIIHDEMNWQNATTRCIMADSRAHLVVIGNAEEQRAVAKMLSSQMTRGAKKYWTAGQRLEPLVNSRFVWKIQGASGDVVTAQMRYTNWERGEPNSRSSTVEGCLEMFGHGTYKWNDVPCNVHKFPVCEIDL